MNEKAQRISIKILLTIPALIIGIVSAFLFMLKPVIELWYPELKKQPEPEPEPEKPTVHEFH